MVSKQLLGKNTGSFEYPQHIFGLETRKSTLNYALWGCNHHLRTYFMCASSNKAVARQPGCPGRSEPMLLTSAIHVIIKVSQAGSYILNLHAG